MGSETKDDDKAAKKPTQYQSQSSTKVSAVQVECGKCMVVHEANPYQPRVVFEVLNSPAHMINTLRYRSSNSHQKKRGSLGSERHLMRSTS